MSNTVQGRRAAPAASRLRRLLLALVCSCAAGVLTLHAQAHVSEQTQGPASPPSPPWLDPDRPIAERVSALVGAMTLEEKVTQMMDQAPAIDRLGVPAYGWWNEALHGVARAGVATVFPQAIALAATFDEPLMHRVATAISDEARAKHHEFVRQGERGRYQGLTFFSPNINIFRDPRWGRGHETYGEDPVLTGRMAVAFIRGMQGDDPTYLKTVATAKHYAVHSGPEVDRHTFNAEVSPRDLTATYLPHFERAVRDGGVMSVMTAYNAVDGVPVSGSEALVDGLLRERWGLDGYVVTDCGAINDMWKRHRYSADAAEASAQAVLAGTDLECGNDFRRLTAAVQRGLLTEADIDRAVTRLFTVRMRLGMFDPPERVAYARIPYAVNDSTAHRALNREVARKSLVLLENDGVLPLAPTVKRLAVIGPTADDVDALVGNYNGTPSAPITILAGLREAAARRGAAVTSARGSEITRGTPEARREAVDLARASDVVVLVLGLTPRQEGEEGEDKSNPGGDRLAIELPAAQQRLFDEIAALDTPVVVVLTGGSAQAIPAIKAHADAILVAWYPGGEGGGAVADVLFGDADPGGRLPITFYVSTNDLPPFSDYSMRGRTYRYFAGEPLWPFGHGRSYTTFRYDDLRVEPAMSPDTSPAVSLTVTNTGRRAGDDVVLAYVTHEDAGDSAPRKALAAFRRVSLEAGASTRVRLPLDPEPLASVDEHGVRHAPTAPITVTVGTLATTLPAPRAASLGGTPSIDDDASAVRVTQLTHGPSHHFFGYIGQSKTIPWSGDGRYILALETTFQERMPTASDAANICLIDAQNGNAVRVVDRTLAWNPQQGTMFYWHPRHPDTQFFFNDRDPRTNKIFTVLYDLTANGGKGGRLREYRFDDTPVGNGGVAPSGEFFTAINYARMARLRPVTGYPDAWDWTEGVAAPRDDGIFRVDIETGRTSLIVSFADLREAVRELDPAIDKAHLFINHTLNSRDSSRIYFFARANFESQVNGARVNSPFTVSPDGTGLRRHDTFIGGHPEWALGTRIIGSANREQVVYDVATKTIVESWGGADRFPNPEGDVALSPDGQWFVNGHREGEHHIYTFLHLPSQRVLKSPPVYLATWRSGPLRLDPAPAWNRASDAIVVPGIADDGTRQMFVVQLPK